MTVIFGVDTKGETKGIDVRDAIIECFYQAHREDAEIIHGGEKVTRRYCENIVKKAFEDTKGSFDEPSKDDILKVMAKLSEFSSNFRSTEEIKKNYDKIKKLVEIWQE
ncbi:hypothetical protein GF389_04360 [Candidatus Dojkabacteria bacterium]|nr:hypothetical protein [Candidatus Dojkabacteria bacterium]